MEGGGAEGGENASLRFKDKAQPWPSSACSRAYSGFFCFVDFKKLVVHCKLSVLHCTVLLIVAVSWFVRLLFCKAGNTQVFQACTQAYVRLAFDSYSDGREIKHTKKALCGPRFLAWLWSPGNDSARGLCPVSSQDLSFGLILPCAAEKAGWTVSCRARRV